MPKQKTHKGTKKRFRLSAKGKAKHRSAGTSHLAGRIEHKRNRKLRGTSPLADAPDLANVSRRFKPEYTRRWIAKPDWIQPYTPMPENIPYQPNTGFVRIEIDAEGNSTTLQIYHGDSTAQLDALVDLLINFDRYTSGQTQIAPLVEQANPTPPAGEAAALSPPAGEAAALTPQDRSDR